jgi:hypothetical protein
MSPTREPMLARLRTPADIALEASAPRFQPKIAHTPDLPAINWHTVSQSAPKLLNTTSGLPRAEAIVMAWTDAEWAALEHVFCGSAKTMGYGSHTTGSWSGWQRYTQSIPTIKGWSNWGQFRLVQIGPTRVLLFKSDTHLDYPGEKYLEQLIRRLLATVKPNLILSTGTAGGARPSDPVGTVNVTNAGTLAVSGQPPSQWPRFQSAWLADWTLAGSMDFAKLLLPVPTTQSDLTSVCGQFNSFYKSTYTLQQLDVDTLDLAKGAPGVNDLARASIPLLSTTSFVVGNHTGNLQGFACVEMDDAIIAKICVSSGISFGSVRNISDPVQNAALPPKVQAHWAQAIYDVYGFYTSFNSALAAWALLAAQAS